MAYRHGVYVSEIQTSVQAAPPVDSALPFVIGSAPIVKGPVLVSSWSQFRDLFGAEDVDPDSRDYTLCAHAYYWFVLAGRGECIMQSVASPAASGAVVDAIASIHTVYERFGRVASILCAPCASEDAAVAAAMVAAVSNIGGRFKCIALVDVPAGYADPDASIGAADLSTHKPTTSPFACLCWPYAGVGDYRFAASSVMCAAINATDGTYGGLPYVSPSNKPLPVTGAYHTAPAEASATFSECTIDELGCVLDSSGDPLTAHDDDETAELSSPDNPEAVFLRNSGNLPYSHAFTGTAGSVYTEEFTLTGVTGSGTVHVVGTVTANPGGGPRTETFDQDFDYVNGKFTIRPSGSYAAWDGWDSFVITDARAAWHVSNASAVTVSPFSVVAIYEGMPESPVYMTREDVNTYLGAFGLVGLRNTAAGWVEWGDNSAAYPGNTDVKDYMIPVRRMFNHVGNLFQIFADGRIDMPLKVRQLEGVVKAFNQVLSGWVGFGALNAASVELDAERNTAESLLTGTVYLRIKIAPPPAMVVIEGVIEYDVAGFEASLA